MAKISDPAIQGLLSKPNHAVVATIDEQGVIHSAVVWVNSEGENLAINSARGRKWPTHLEQNATVNVLVYDQENPYEYFEVRGKAREVEGGDPHIDALTQKYMGQDTYPFRQEGEERVKFLVEPNVVRHQKQG